MAKSIRSKHRRRMRSVKRTKVGKKDLVRLKETLMNDVLNNKDANMEDIVTVKTAAEVKEQIAGASSSKVYDKKKKTDEHGQYPEWMSQRAIGKIQAKNRKEKNSKKKQAKKKKSAW